MSKQPQIKQNYRQRLAGIFGGRPRAERQRLEAFLDAVPGEYCGFSPDGGLAYSEGFSKLLGLEQITGLNDIQHNLTPSDAAALEGLFIKLQENGTAFSLSVQTAADGRFLKLSGTRGHDTTQREQFDVLWLEDISAASRERIAYQSAREQAEDERGRLQAALDSLPAPLWMRNTATDILWCNKAYADILDMSAASIIAEQKELPAKVPARKSALRAPGRALAQAALDSSAVAATQTHIVVGGQRRLMSIQEVPLPALRTTIGIARDISREEELENEANRNSAANKELLEQLGSAIGIFDAAQRLEFYNSAFAQLWQLEDQYLNAKPKLGDLMEKLREHRRLPEQIDFRRFKDSWIGMFTSLITPHEEMLYLPDDTALRMLAVPHPMGGLMMTFEDVTSRLELESSYNTLIAVQKETLDNLAEGVAVYGGDGRLKLWNPSFMRLWNLTPEDMEGEPHITRLAIKMIRKFEDAAQSEAKKSLISQSINRRLSEGQMQGARNVLIHFSTVPLPDGGVLVTHVDVTDKVRVENALREKNAALEAAERLKLDFLANVSYQLRTPLNAIMGFAEILGNQYFGTLNERQTEYAGGIQEAGQRLLSLIDDILDLSTIEAGYLELNSSTVAIGDVLQGVYTLTMDWGRKEGITVKLDCPKNIGTLVADERRLKQVLFNLVRNAITFTPEGGTIIIKAARKTEMLEISVIDDGAGIPETAQDRVFEPFARAGNENGPGRNGAGLGLALVKNIVELHHGTVSLDSREGSGTTVKITLPLAATDNAAVPEQNAQKRN